MNEVILLLHPAFGVFAILAAGWVFVETLNASDGSVVRLRKASMACAVLMWLTYIVAGYWYVFHYGPDKAAIKAGSWAFGHNFFMETKEHVFFMVLLLATFLPVVAKGNVSSSKSVRRIVLWVSGLTVALGLAMEGAGSIISASVKMGL